MFVVSGIHIVANVTGPCGEMADTLALEASSNKVEWGFKSLQGH